MRSGDKQHVDFSVKFVKDQYCHKGKSFSSWEMLVVSSQLVGRMGKKYEGVFPHTYNHCLFYWCNIQSHYKDHKSLLLVLCQCRVDFRCSSHLRHKISIISLFEFGFVHLLVYWANIAPATQFNMWIISYF